MYFSLVTPEPGLERDAAHEWLQGAYSEHQLLWRFFPSPHGTRRDFLFRRRDIDGVPRFYVVSERKPEAPHSAWHVQTRSYMPDLAEGTRLNFELRANPVIARGTEGRGKRHDVVMDEKKRLLAARGLTDWAAWTPGRKTANGEHDPRPELAELVARSCTAWLEARAERYGFTLDSASLRIEGYMQHGGKKDQLRFSTVDFNGALVVTHRERFAKALKFGIGRAKAFGCGLLLVRRED